MNHTEMKSDQLAIDSDLVRRLVKNPFPEWRDLPIMPVANGGWDNRTFHLGKTMLVGMPSAAHYASQVEKENEWLPKLAPFLPLAIPEPVTVGKPAEGYPFKGYPFKWSIYRWLPGDNASTAHIDNLSDLATRLATWTFFKDESRAVFRTILDLDDDTWMCGRAWTFWKALVIAAEFTNPNNAESARCWYMIDDVIVDFRSKA